MKLESDDLEKSYIMGHRILIFLRECLPRHPDFQKTLAFKIRNKSRKEALALERCLEEIALSIDEEDHLSSAAAVGTLNADQASSHVVTAAPLSNAGHQQPWQCWRCTCCSDKQLQPKRFSQ